MFLESHTLSKDTYLSPYVKLLKSVSCIDLVLCLGLVVRRDSTGRTRDVGGVIRLQIVVVQKNKLNLKYMCKILCKLKKIDFLIYL